MRSTWSVKASRQITKVDFFTGYFVVSSIHSKSGSHNVAEKMTGNDGKDYLFILSNQDIRILFKNITLYTPLQPRTDVSFEVRQFWISFLCLLVLLLPKISILFGFLILWPWVYTMMVISETRRAH